jgi:hypothetical protein
MFLQVWDSERELIVNHDMTRMFFRTETNESMHSRSDAPSQHVIERKYELVGRDGQQKLLLRYRLKALQRN